ncbi:response regulator transcription factor [Ideonella sp. 4Y16]|uniref:Response regulator transcription factor n=1 Tax=Ideonella alba TaxID=2824118 RepID=A0A940YDG7_9BURK|nr:response regulator transcription factor [Ideonella alba]MBQ0933096.1 response regulator transcription factor [Ideonella alba]MBQ0945824.1 response regulator transcription factor [Ideonella alba]
MIRVVLVDDHAVVRMGFRMLLQAPGSDIEVVGEAADGEALLKGLPQWQPEVVVMDLTMPGLGGLETLRRLRARDDAPRVLVLSAHEDTAYPRRALNAGAQGFVSKRSAPETLPEAIRAVAQGKRYLDAQTAQALALSQLDGSASPFDALSEREFEVFTRLARGKSVAEIAEALSLSPSTVGTHLYNIKQKLNAGNQAELTLLALRWGVIEA